MNEHGKKIWQAWLDGQEVQSWCGEYPFDPQGWKTDDPTTAMDYDMPHKNPSYWRIKPEKKTFSIKYRIALIRLTEEHISPILIGSGDYEDSESRGDFIKWITEERVEEVEEPL